MCLSGPEEAKCLAYFNLPPIRDNSSKSTETITPFLTIFGVESTFLAVRAAIQQTVSFFSSHQCLTYFVIIHGEQLDPEICSDIGLKIQKEDQIRYD